MQIVKERNKSDLHNLLEILNKRMTLEDEYRKILINFEKGYEGELHFDNLLKRFYSGEGIVLNDLKISYRGSSTQIDSLLITQHSIELFEIKNYSGSYSYSKNKMMSLKGIEIANPLTQLNRTLSLIRQLMNEWGIDLDVNGHIVFVNNHFTLYVGEPSYPFILPTQIELFLSQLSSQSRHIKQSHQFLADKLLSYSLRELPHQKEHPHYNWDHLKKGLSCKGCGSLNPVRTQRRITCLKCTQQETVSAALYRNTDELMLLFPNENLTTPLLYKWVNGFVSKERISKFLKTNFIMHGVSRAIYYEKEASSENKPARVIT